MVLYPKGENLNAFGIEYIMDRIGTPTSMIKLEYTCKLCRIKIECGPGHQRVKNNGSDQEKGSESAKILFVGKYW